MNDKVYVGVDVSKAELEIKIAGGRGASISNKPKNIMRFILRLQEDHGDGMLQVCYESTGVYGDALRDCCLEAGLDVSILNPKRVKDWAKGIGKFAKKPTRLMRRSYVNTPKQQCPVVYAVQIVGRVDKFSGIGYFNKIL